MKKLIITAIAVMFVMTSFAQDKKMLTPVDASYNNYDVYPRGKSYKWLGESEKYVFNEKGELRYQTPGEKSSHTLLNLDMLNGIAKDNGVKEFERMPNITWIDENSGYFYKAEGEEISLNIL
ncbi:MAG: hypothetical protein IJT45_04940, partial [Bacteroidales bacterium]|nr:hypothetical protein [Bacteroidales bacterium]